METVSIVASVVSVIIGLFAIWLSVTFYKMSAVITAETKDAAKDMGAAVDRLEKLFDHLYTDTFTMMKDTVSDMRRHIWPEHKPEKDLNRIVEEKSAEKMGELKEEVSRELEELVGRVSQTDARLTEVRSNIEAVVNRVISESKKVEREVKAETVRDTVLQHLDQMLRKRGVKFATAVEFVETFAADVEITDALAEIHSMALDGILKIEPEVKEWRQIEPESRISFP